MDVFVALFCDLERLVWGKVRSSNLLDGNFGVMGVGWSFEAEFKSVYIHVTLITGRSLLAPMRTWYSLLSNTMDSLHGRIS